MVANAEYLKKFEAAGVEVITLDPADVSEARAKAVKIWDKVAGGDALTKEILASQRSLMSDFRLLSSSSLIHI
mgnify:CR=1 FL=1